MNAASQLIQLSSGKTGSRPAQTGTVSPGNPDPTKPAKDDTMDVLLNGVKVGTTAGLPAAQTTLSGLAAALQSLVSALPGLGNASVSVIGSASTTTWLVAAAGTVNPSDVLTFNDGGTGIATKLGFAGLKGNVQEYALGGKAVLAQALPGASQVAGGDGTWDPAGDASGVTTGLIGDPNLNTGIYALLDVDLFNIVCIPTTMSLPDTNAAAVASAAEQLCTQRRAMYILDPPQK